MINSASSATGPCSARVDVACEQQTAWLMHASLVMVAEDATVSVCLYVWCVCLARCVSDERWCVLLVVVPVWCEVLGRLRREWERERRWWKQPYREQRQY